jgi:hypothetical protein
MRHGLALFLFVLVSLSWLNAGPAPAAPKPQKVSVLGADPDPNNQTILMILSNFPPDGDAKSVEWGLVVSYDNGTSVFLQSSGELWTPTVIGGTQAGEGGPKPLPPVAGAPLVKRKTPSIFLVTLPPGYLSSHVTSVLVTVKIPASLAVTFDGKPFQWTPPAKACSYVLCPATSKGESAIYLSGLYSPAFHSAAQYTIDGEGIVTTPLNSNKTFLAGGSGSVSTDNRPTADPNSFVVAGLLDWVVPFSSGRAQGLLLQWNVAEFEFDSQATNKTFVSSPVAQIPIYLFPGPGKKKGSLRAWITPYGGLEIGTNLSNAIDSGGSGFVFRGLLGSTFDATFKTPWKYLSQVEIMADYSARLPATSEVFTNTHYISATGKSVSLPIYSTQARHHLTDELDLTLQKPMILTIKHEYGELPPGFRKVDNKISIGLTVMLSHTNSPDSVTGSKGRNETTW